MTGRFLVLLLISIFFFSCNYSRMKETGSFSPNEALQKLGKLDYATTSRAVLGPRCVSCHSSGGGNQGGVNLESYQNVRNQLARVAYRALESRDMPPRTPLSNDEMTILKSWLESGAPENYSDAQEQGDPNLELGPTNWEKISTKIFAKKCLDCHSPPSPEAQLDLTSYELVKAKVLLIFDRTIIKQDMPIEPYPALSPRERKVLLHWFNMGLPQ